MKIQVRHRFTFEAAHVLPHHLGKCKRLHGHSYRLEVALEGPLCAEGPKQGMVEDFDLLGTIVRDAVIERLDHTYLNDRFPNPTAELIAVWIWEQLEGKLPGLAEVALWETSEACAVIRP